MNPNSKLNSLILAGGFSRRFGMDKALVRLQPDGLPAITVMAHKLRSLGLPVFLSVRADQKLPAEGGNTWKVLRDEVPDSGPIGGLNAAFRHAPDTAWLVVACDLFSLDCDTLARLLASRHPAAAVMAVRNPQTRRPEPLCAIYEPACALTVEQQLAAGKRRMRSLLGRLPLAWISPASPDAVENYNHRERLPLGLVVGGD